MQLTRKIKLNDKLTKILNKEKRYTKSSWAEIKKDSIYISYQIINTTPWKTRYKSFNYFETKKI